MKIKIVSLLLSVALIFAFITACNTDTNNSSEVSSEESSLEETQSPIPSPTASPMPLPLNIHQQGEYFTPIMGLCEDYPIQRSSLEEIERDFSLMAEYGIEHIRVSIAWGDYEPSKNVHDWSYLDNTVELANQYGIKLYPYIAYSPRWATGGDWKTPPTDLNDWYEFVYKVVDRYKDSITHWELWNEGDNADFWSGSWDEQLELIKTGAIAVKDANPDAKAIFGGLTNLSQIHVNSIFTSNVADYIDVLNIHFYNETWSQSPTEDIYTSTQRVADMIRRHGGKIELWIAEIGYGDYVREDGSITDWTKIRAPYEKTRHFQAVTFIRSMGRILATQDVSNILWYEIKNLRSDSPAIGEYNNYHLGVIDSDYFPKHIWFAMSFTYNLFSDPHKSIDDDIVVLSSTARQPFIHGYEKENGDVILLAWNRGTTDESIEISIPGTFSKAISYSVTGEKEIIEFDNSDGSAKLNIDLIPEDMNTIELIVSQEIPSRLTIKDANLVNVSGSRYRISATITNIGDIAAKGLTSDLFINPGFETDEELKVFIDELVPGQEYKVSWNVTNVDSDSAPQAWISVNHPDSPIAATLLELK